MSSETDDRSIQDSMLTRQPWEPMTLTYTGRVADVVQGGGGKMSNTGGDPGDIRKETGTG